MAKINIGITTSIARDDGNVLWSNGITQNIVFLAHLFTKLDIVGDVYIVVCPGNVAFSSTLFGFKTISIDQAANGLDLILEVGARGAEPSHIESLHKRGGKLVSYVAGNVMAMNFEELARNVRHGDSVSNGWDAAWITPQHWKMCHSYVKMTRSSNTSIAPHIWEPLCINMAAEASGRNIAYSDPQDNKWNIGCFDPNINAIKTFHLPTLVCENAYRIDRAQINSLLLFSLKHLINSQHLNQFISCLDLFKDKKIFIEERHMLSHVMGTHVNAVVTHQWENNLNYLYWEILYLGWPLIHNSDHFCDVGYYYPDFDAGQGGAVLQEALARHKSKRLMQREPIKELLWEFSIFNPAVQNEYKLLIEGAFS